MTLKLFTGEPAEEWSISDEDRANAVALLDAYVGEVKQRHEGRLNTKIKPKDYPAAGKIMEASPVCQLAVTLSGASLLVKDSFADPQRDFAIRELLKCLFRKELPYDEQSTRQLFEIVEVDLLAVSMLPIGLLISNLQNFVMGNGLSSAMRDGLTRLAKTLHPNADCAEDRKHGQKIADILDSVDARVPAPIFDLNTGEAWTDALLVGLGQFDDEQRLHWQMLLEHCGTATQSKPSKKWLRQAEVLLQSVDRANFVDVLCPALSAIGQPGKSQKQNRGGYVFFGHPTVIHDTHADTLRGLIWATSLFDDDLLISQIGDAAEKSFQKVPEVGPRSPKTGNACLMALSTMANTNAVAQLGRLKSRAKHASTRKQIARALERAADNAGMTAEDIEEIAVPKFGMTEVGRYTERIGEFTAEIAIHPNNTPELRWIKPDGKPQKAVPAAVKTACADQLKAIRKKLKDIGVLLPSIRSRLEQLFLTERTWSLADFRTRYIDQPLVGVGARRLIWNLRSGEKAVAAIWNDGQFVDAVHQPVEWLNDDCQVSIWHPLHADADEVFRWREWLEEHGCTQPFKQAHREVYLLTDAERETRVYSNRFASHIIRQHQFSALCQQRGWRYHLQGDFDSSNAPYLELPRHDLQAQYFVDPVEGLEGTSDHFIYIHLSTDQVRFCRLGTYVPIPLEEIPSIVFSEVMRDVDLFVGVTSIGNDPRWRDAAAEEPPHYDYWHRVSFGDLSQTAQTRKEVLERVIPRLKIAGQCRFADRFLIVKGKLREYKIHLGSGNILMSPNDQYLCIVQERGAGAKQTDSIYLPFDGDSTLTMILSKAFLLADEHKIKDQTILQQITRAEELIYE